MVNLVREIEAMKFEETGEEAIVWKNSTRHIMDRDHMSDHQMAKINRPLNKDGV